MEAGVFGTRPTLAQYLPERLNCLVNHMHRDLALPAPERKGISYSFGVFATDSAIKCVSAETAERDRESLLVFRAEVVIFVLVRLRSGLSEFAVHVW